MRTAIVAGFVALMWAAAPVPGQAQQLDRVPSMCADCHGGIVTDKMSAITHAESVSCLTCHHIGFTNDPSTALERRLDACATCHEDLLASHTETLQAEEPRCTECHSIHGEPPLEDATAVLSAQCLTCHAASHTLHQEAGRDAPECVQCHTVHTGRAFHPEDGKTIEGCVSCHEEVHPSHADVDGDLTCTACHSVGEAATVDAALAAEPENCLSCHNDTHPTHATVEEDIAPTCVSCHGFGSDPPMALAGTAVSQRCGTCHTEELDEHASGGHAAALALEPNPDLPTCLTCHVTHVDPGEERAYVRLAATVRCMECHADQTLVDEYGLPRNVSASYVEDFHGATTRFLWNHPGSEVGQPAVMVCSDCHGAHEVGWSEDDVVADVCAQCHEQGDERLAGAWLGHDDIGPTNKLPVWLVRFFYYLMIPFMLIGLTLNIVFHLVDQRRKGARVVKTEGMQKIRGWLRREKKPEVETVVRFSVTERLEHVGSMITFILLVVTGLPQTRPELGIANTIIGLFGGIGMTRFVHRVVGFLFVALMVIHVAKAVTKAVRARRLPVMTPTRKDFEDVIQSFRHFLLREPAPKAGKFDASEKFEYWGLFAGGLVMGGTGIVLVFPELVSQVLPGILVAALRTMHGLEATFAVLVVGLWHAYGVIFRPEVFPLDTTIFTGKMSVERLKHEHPLEYERLFPDRAAAEPDQPVGDTKPMLDPTPDPLVGH
jgi:cytochrome b subunit of formate dehydrogenase